MIVPGANEEFRILFPTGTELPATDKIVASIRVDGFSADKTGADLGISTEETGVVLAISITQAESLQMNDNSRGKIQVNYLIPSEGQEPRRRPTAVVYFTVGEQLYRQVME